MSNYYNKFVYNNAVRIDTKTVKTFQKTILDWYKDNQRDLPWRKNRNPYHIMVSEIMLQQTQVNRVVTKFEEWLKRFPTVESLAEAPVADVLQYWSGLGYNRRALNLKRAAEAIVKEHKGIFPQDEATLLKLPGIGPYTSRAILCFAFDKQVAVVDTNVKKIILTQIIPRHAEQNAAASPYIILKDAPKENPTLSEKDFQAIAEELLPHGHAYDWNQALMDYASNVLKKEKIPIPKQSKFAGSRRQYRGRILKLLLEKNSIHVADIGVLIKPDYTDNDKEWLQQLLDEMTKEGFIAITNNTVTLSS
jgi:A/G-specific adenine glycosylase